MSESTINSGPSLGSEVHEVQAVFGSDAALQEAVGQLRMSGFDHADLSLPQARPAPRQATPEQGAADPIGEDDVRQMRTLHTSMAGTAGALAAAAVTVATGGAAAVAVGAAAVAGLGAAAVGHSVGDAQQTLQHAQRDAAAENGELVLAVRAPDAAKQARAEAVLRAAGAVRVAAIRRRSAAIDGGVDSSGWTG